MEQARPEGLGPFLAQPLSFVLRYVQPIVGLVSPYSQNFLLKGILYLPISTITPGPLRWVPLAPCMQFYLFLLGPSGLRIVLAGSSSFYCRRPDCCVQ
jgi:hypothetical protein